MLNIILWDKIPKNPPYVQIGGTWSTVSGQPTINNPNTYNLANISVTQEGTYGPYKYTIFDTCSQTFKSADYTIIVDAGLKINKVTTTNPIRLCINENDIITDVIPNIEYSIDRYTNVVDEVDQAKAYSIISVGQHNNPSALNYLATAPIDFVPSFYTIDATTFANTTGSLILGSNYPNNGSTIMRIDGFGYKDVVGGIRPLCFPLGNSITYTLTWFKAGLLSNTTYQNTNVDSGNSVSSGLDFNVISSSAFPVQASTYHDQQTIFGPAFAIPSTVFKITFDSAYNSINTMQYINGYVTTGNINDVVVYCCNVGHSMNVATQDYSVMLPITGTGNKSFETLNPSNLSNMRVIPASSGVINAYIQPKGTYTIYYDEQEDSVCTGLYSFKTAKATYNNPIAQVNSGADQIQEIAEPIIISGTNNPNFSSSANLTYIKSLFTGITWSSIRAIVVLPLAAFITREVGGIIKFNKSGISNIKINTNVGVYSPTTNNYAVGKLRVTQNSVTYRIDSNLNNTNYETITSSYNGDDECVYVLIPNSSNVTTITLLNNSINGGQVYQLLCTGGSYEKASNVYSIQKTYFVGSYANGPGQNLPIPVQTY